jgi:hypothetical protein
MKRKGLSTILAEVHVPVGVEFPLSAFQRAFEESQSNDRKGGAEVWMSLKPGNEQQLTRYPQ